MKDDKDTFSLILDKKALAYSKAGMSVEAVATEERAIEMGKKEVNDPKYGGRVFDYTITGYEETLKKYKSALK